MNPKIQQEKSLIIAVGLIVLLLGLIFVFAWQKNKLFNTLPLPAKQGQNQPISSTTQDTAKEKTAKEKIIEQIAPNTDLAQFDLPEGVLNKTVLENPDISPAYNRSGRIATIDLVNSKLSFIDMTFEEKMYEVIISPKTEIRITTMNETYANSDSPTPLNTKTNTGLGKLSDLQEGDNITVRAEQMINSDSYEAKYIETTHFVSKILNN
jgi:hypothetical protein